MLGSAVLRTVAEPSKPVKIQTRSSSHVISSTMTNLTASEALHRLMVTVKEAATTTLTFEAALPSAFYSFIIPCFSSSY